MDKKSDILCDLSWHYYDSIVKKWPFFMTANHLIRMWGILARMEPDCQVLGLSLSSWINKFIIQVMLFWWVAKWNYEEKLNKTCERVRKPWFFFLRENNHQTVIICFSLRIEKR